MFWSIKLDPVLNNYLTQTTDNNVRSGVRCIPCLCFFVRVSISNRNAIYFYFPDGFTNRKDLSCLLKILDQRTDYVNRSSNRLRLIMNYFDWSSSECTALSIWQRFGRSIFVGKLLVPALRLFRVWHFNKVKRRECYCTRLYWQNSLSKA